MPTLVVAAVSARWLAEAAVQAGYRVISLDAFGDVDTRRISRHWAAINRPGSLRIDPDRTLAALSEARLDGRVTGWLAGSGFEGLPDLLERGAALLPLIGTAPQDVRRVRDPLEFFAALRAQAIGYPPTRFELPDPPEGPEGWLIKDANGHGGWHIRSAGKQAALRPGEYFQQWRPGQPMSATFVANGEQALVLGFNQLITHGHRYAGVIGPVPLPGVAAREAVRAVAALTAAFRLRGLGSLDFLLDGNRVSVLEANPRPPASLALYPALAPLQAHMRAVAGELPPLPADAPGVRGTQVLFAPAPCRIGSAGSDILAGMTHCHDVPTPGTRFDTGDPVCSVSAQGAEAIEVRQRLVERLAEAARLLSLVKEDSE